LTPQASVVTCSTIRRKEASGMATGSRKRYATTEEPYFNLLTGLAALAPCLAVITLLLRETSRPDLLGLRTVCAFAPASTLLLLGLGLFFRMLRDAIYPHSASRTVRPAKLESELDDRNADEPGACLKGCGAQIQRRSA
jgi:hypothetical protein